MHLSFVLTLLSNNDTLVLFVLTAELVCLYSYSKDRNNVIKGTSYREREREKGTTIYIFAQPNTSKMRVTPLGQDKKVHNQAF